MKILAHMLACIAAIFLMQLILPDMIQYASPLTVVAAGLVLWAVNTLIRPVIKLVTLPLTLLTLGLFSLVVNTLMVLLVDYLVAGISLSGFPAAFILALLVSVLQIVIIKQFHEDR
jgi:putative membrane protein